MSKLIFLSLLILLGMYCQEANAEQEITVPTTYVNDQLGVLPFPGSSHLYVANTCGSYDNSYTVTVRVFNPNNAQNNPNLGITFATVANHPFPLPPSVTPLCTTNNTSPYKTSCSATNGKGDIYIKVTGNNRQHINFAIMVTFEKSSAPQTPMQETAVSQPSTLPTLKDTDIEELQQVVTYDQSISLSYLNVTKIRMRLCPTKNNGKREVTSIFQADDDQAKSLIAQAVCTIPSCTFDTKPPQRVAENFADLPVNIATAPAKNYTDLWVYAVAFNGPLDRSSGWPKGKFRFGVSTRVSP